MKASSIVANTVCIIYNVYDIKNYENTKSNSHMNAVEYFRVWYLYIQISGK